MESNKTIGMESTLRDCDGIKQSNKYGIYFKRPTESNENNKYGIYFRRLTESNENNRYGIYFKRLWWSQIKTRSVESTLRDCDGMN